MTKSIDQLRDEVEWAKVNLYCADMIDNEQRRQIELAACRRRVEQAEAALAEAVNFSPSEPTER